MGFYVEIDFVVVLLEDLCLVGSQQVLNAAFVCCDSAHQLHNFEFGLGFRRVKLTDWTGRQLNLSEIPTLGYL